MSACSILIALLAAAPTALPVPVPLEVAGAPARIEWAEVVATANDDWINDLVPLRNGNLLGVGFVNRGQGSFASDWQALALELRFDGSKVAERRYGEGGGADAFWSAVEDAEGRRIYGGFTTRIGPGGINGYVLFSSPDGAIIKENGFGGPGYDRFTDLARAGNGYVLLGHSQPAGEDKRRIYLVKVDPSGQLMWERIHDALETWGALYIEPAPNGGFIIAGGVSADGDDQMFAMKVDDEGRELWRKRVGTTDWDETNHGIVIRPDGRIVLVGYTHPHGGEANDIVAATLSSDGEIERLERFGGAADDRAILAKPAPDGSIWIVGQTASAGAGGSDVLVTSLDATGSFTGSALTLGGPENDNGTAIFPLGAEALIVAGYSRGLGGGGQDAFIARLSRPSRTSPHPAFRRTAVIPVR